MGQIGIVVVLLLLLQLGRLTYGQNTQLQQVYIFKISDLYGLQQLFADWNRSTPELEKNLAGWRAISLDRQLSFSPCFKESWQGVLCLRELTPTPKGFYYQQYNVSIVGLELNDASLVGSLPPAIGNLSSLVSLTITGNKELVSPIPNELQLLSYNLNILDLQGNGFNGSIPPTLTNLLQLQQLDLSGNEFDGELSVDFRNLTSLRTLNLSRNALQGSIQTQHFQNLSQLITLDLSSNRFTGQMFDLTSSYFLNTLNVSRNLFSGDLQLSNIFNVSSSFNLKVVDFANNSFKGPFPDFRSWTNITVLDLSDNDFEPTAFPLWLQNFTNLQILRLSGNNLTGEIPNNFWQGFKYLRTVILDNNQISGALDIRDFNGLQKVERASGNVQKLEMLSIRYNAITNVLYNGPDYKSIEQLGINLEGNPYCQNVPSQDYLKQCVCLQICVSADITQRDSKRAAAIIIATSVSAAVFALAVLVIAFVFWKTRKEKQTLLLQVQQHFAEKDIKPTIYTFNELRAATEDFSERTKIGEGSFGAVYKGQIHANASPVAVKQLFLKNQAGSEQNITEFLNEVVLVTAIKHRNLVNLKGCCVREDQRLLVYEYVDNNDLAQHLFHSRPNQHLTWSSRYNIALGVARGLHYLHTSASPRIIHRDIKASNVLMDRDFQPKIADFGLALLFPDEKTHIITSDIAGTRGYWAPEYVTMGQLSEKVDIYSYGILLLELVSGRKNLNHNMPRHKVYLCQWAKDLYNNSNIMELLDPVFVLTKAEELEARCLLNIALLCIQVEPERRPTMGNIVATLEGGTLNLEVEGMRNLFQEKEPLTWAQLEERPLRKIGSTFLFSESTESSSMISLTSMQKYNSGR